MEHVVLKSNKYGLVVVLDDEIPFEELLESVGEKFQQASGFFGSAQMALVFQGRELNPKEERLLITKIVEKSKIQVVCLMEDDKIKENIYKEAVLKSLEAQKENDQQGLFYRGTLKNGEVLESESSIVILGNVNPGAQVVSKGNVVILGCCMGHVYAGASGRQNCFVAALVLKPAQIRIAGKTARSGITKKEDSGDYPIDPKIAYLADDHFMFETIKHDTLAAILDGKS